MDSVNPGSPADRLRTVLHYHEKTKHRHYRYADALGYMDWDTQPNPFRRFEGAPVVSLALPSADRTPGYDQIYVPRGVVPRSVDRETISELFFYALSLSAWKSYMGITWSLRVNPSSGNLHPTEAYLLIRAVEGLSDHPAVHHYAPEIHALERRAEFDPAVWSELVSGLPEGAFFIGLSSIYWRESWKYGERAFRYCQHDAGHALAALRISAAALGWNLTLLPSVPEPQLAKLLGIDRGEEAHPAEWEAPTLLAAIAPSGGPVRPGTRLPPRAALAMGSATWTGKPNCLSSGHHDWPIIDAVGAACRRTDLEKEPTGGFDSDARSIAVPCPVSESGHPRSQLTVGRIVRQRRSCLALDGRTGVSHKQFYSMLARVVPQPDVAPWDSIPWPPAVHLGLFVHRVEGLSPGLYALVRDAAQRDAFQEHLDPSFPWSAPPTCPTSLPLFLLKECDLRSLAIQVSCGQQIAGDGAFSVAMLAKFEPVLSEQGPHFYPRLFWETGMIGQILYLESEAEGRRGTGMGCYLDDSIHEAFGIRSRAFQCLYSFTTGGHLEDTRLTTLPAYPLPPTT